MEVFLVRHTTPDIEKGICYGQANIEVTSSFLEEATHIQQQLQTHQFNAVYASPLIRCKKLAEHLASEIIYDSRLMEMNFGDWELKNWNDIPKENLDPWMQDFVNLPATNGESYIELHQRTVAFYQDIQQQNHQKVLVITHAGVMRSLWAYWHQTPLEKSFDLKLTYGQILHYNTLAL